MPHGGPSARDEWGFDWLSQFYAQRGFVVLQPNYRGSSGYGDDWYQENGFKSWKTSIGDICDAGRWMVAQGMADPAKLAIVGWSYGGYAALQVNVLDPDLFKAVVAVAPVADLALLKAQAAAFTNSALVNDFIGSGAHIEEGSPAQNAAKFKAPVLMFHGDIDLNVDIAQARKMDKALRGAKKSSELIVYPKLEHSLRRWPGARGHAAQIRCLPAQRPEAAGAAHAIVLRRIMRRCSRTRPLESAGGQPHIRFIASILCWR